MAPTILSLTVALLLQGEPDKPSQSPRPPSLLAPSLPQLSDEEEEKLDQVINRFILYDTGKLKGAEGKKALQEFNKLGPEATFALIRGLNKAATIDHSCPALTIGRKLERTFRSTKDTQLLEFARENVGAGVTRSRHMGVIRGLRMLCSQRKSALGRGGNLRTNP